MTEEELKQAIAERNVEALQRLEAPRVHSVRAESVNEEERSVEAVLSTETPVEMFDYDRWDYVPEILVASAMRIRGGRSTVPILDSHNRWSTSSILGVVKDIRVEGGQVVGRLVFDDTDEGRAAWTRVRSGSLTDVSVGYGVAKRTFIGEDTTQNIDGRNYTGPVNVVTDWELKELSPTPIGADVNATMRSEAKRILNQSRVMPGNQKEGPNMEPKEQPGADPATTSSGDNGNRTVQTPAPAPPAPEPVDANAVRKAERERIAAIRSLGNEAGIEDAKIEELIDSGATVDKARAAFWDTFAGKNAAQGRTNGGDVQIVRDEREQLRSAAVDAVLVRSGVLTADKAVKGYEEYEGYGLEDLARKCLVTSGRLPYDRAMALKGDQLFMLAMERGGNRTAFVNGRSGALNHGTSDFPYILADSANKSMQRGYELAPTTYQHWVRTVQRNDFKTGKVVALNGGTGFKKVNENGEIPEGRFAEKQESYAIATFGESFSITRQTLINDDMGAFTKIPMAIGVNARTLLNELVYSILLANSGTGQTMAEDDKAIFHTDHGNYKSTGGAIPSVATLALMRSAMSLQKAFGNNRTLNLQPRFLLVTPTHATTAEQVIGSSVDPSKSNGTFNPFFNKLVPIEEPILQNGIPDLDGTAYTGYANAYIGVADNNQIDTIELGLLNGRDAPSLMEEENTGGILGMKFYGWIDGAAHAIDWRGFYRNIGAAS